jgi:hypothetical protein
MLAAAGLAVLTACFAIDVRTPAYARHDTVEA